MEQAPAGSPSLEGKIHLIRGVRVMLDSDLAELYGVPTKQLNQAVRRNADRFPADFAFTITNQELTNLRSQIVTSSLDWGGRRYGALAFTEQGVAMLSSVLKSPTAIQVNIAIMRAFVQMRGVLLSNKEFEHKLSELETKYDRNFEVVFKAIRELMQLKAAPRKRIRGLESD
jgi:ORF6N domain